jgi:hypothetical protein
MSRRIGFALAWLAGVAAMVLLANAAVGMVGDRVTSRSVPRISRASVEAELASSEVQESTTTTSTDGGTLPGAGGVAGASGGSGAVGSGASGSGSASVGGSGPSSAGAVTDNGGSFGSSSGTGSSGSGSGEGSSGGPGPSPTTTTPAAVSATYTSVGGSVGVSCVGSSMSRTFASPAAGYSLDHSGSSGPDEVDVRFVQVSGRHESRISVRCVGGAPTETIEER